MGDAWFIFLACMWWKKKKTPREPFIYLILFYGLKPLSAHLVNGLIDQLIICHSSNSITEHFNQNVCHYSALPWVLTFYAWLAPLYFIIFIAYLRFCLWFSVFFKTRVSSATFATKGIQKQYEHNLWTRHTDVLKIKHNISCLFLVLCICGVLANVPWAASSWLVQNTEHDKSQL